MSALQTRRVAIVALMHNNAAIAASWTSEVLKLALFLAAHAPDNVLVSVVESGSRDKTVDYLQVMDASLKAANIPRRIVTGFVNNVAAHEHRIERLASLRSVALQPILNSRQACEDVVFLNDVVHCAFQVITAPMMPFSVFFSCSACVLLRCSGEMLVVHPTSMRAPTLRAYLPRLKTGSRNPANNLLMQ